MDSTAEEFLRHLDGRYEPLLAKVTGVARFDLVTERDTDSWLVDVEKGTCTVSHTGGGADCTVGGDRALLDRVCRGEENAMAAVLRGALVCTGDVDLLYAIQRIFPGPDHDTVTSGTRQ